MLMKDNMLDAEIAKKQDFEEESTDQKLERMEGSLDNIHTRFARLLADYNTMQLKLKQRITKLEKSLLLDNISVTSVTPNPEQQQAGKRRASFRTFSRTSQHQLKNLQASDSVEKQDEQLPLLRKESLVTADRGDKSRET